MKIFIQYMVSLRCKLMVKSELEKLNIKYKSVELGEVMLFKNLSKTKKEKLKKGLHRSGLELMDDKNSMLIEKIINIIVEMVHYSDDVPKVNFSVFLSEKMGQDYHKLAGIFSKTKGMTIEQFIINHKVERIKELIIYDELNFTEISHIMHYNSISHLSRQFKQVTGLTPSFFKSMSHRQRFNLEDL
ncbi:AraC-type DNA-binding protein [Belliella buryatensis]|uniref:AraC-type DNA-binding protein n=1 Tax=Belliella buryatensis TaxID=1500549 RepID=A0A239CPE1_9BACT|nr:AraC family transcriptional regulator [Belliella buryatensis]SNS21203.1 AraC-type DNA-binding protein [Belliella buryatensis]